MFRMELRMGLLLRWGVIAACVVMTIGAAIYLKRHATEPVSYAQFRGEPEAYRTVPGVLRAAFGESGRGIIQLGCLIMIATPVLRVAFAIWVFAVEKDRLYVAVSCTVFVLLLTGLTA